MADRPGPGSVPKTVSELFPSKWVKARDLPPGGRVVTIERFEVRSFRRPSGAEVPGLVLYFYKATKGMITNQTQAHKLEELLGSEVFGDWVGKRVLLRPGKAHNGEPTIIIEAAPEMANGGEAQEGK